MTDFGKIYFTWQIKSCEFGRWDWSQEAFRSQVHESTGFAQHLFQLTQTFFFFRNMTRWAMQCLFLSVDKCELKKKKTEPHLGVCLMSTKPANKRLKCWPHAPQFIFILSTRVVPSGKRLDNNEFIIKYRVNHSCEDVLRKNKDTWGGWM